jgi:hypothetical protein
MTDNNPSDPSGDGFQQIAHRSLDAGIADEGAGYTKAIDANTGDDENAEGEGKSTRDRSGTSETD